MKRNALIVAAMGLGLFIASCGSDSGDKAATETPAATTETTSETSTVTPTGEVVEVLLQSDDNMKYDKTEIRVKEGQTVKLTLKHIGTMPKSSMGHNFVLLKQGVDMKDFAEAAAAQAEAPDFELSDMLTGDVIAHTSMIGGGESTTIEFLTPAKGSYEFLCSFPGHYGMMKGTFIVE